MIDSWDALKYDGVSHTPDGIVAHKDSSPISRFVPLSWFVKLPMISPSSNHASSV
jgi:hypothetical protein